MTPDVEPSIEERLHAALEEVAGSVTYDQQPPMRPDDAHPRQRMRGPRALVMAGIAVVLSVSVAIAVRSAIDTRHHVPASNTTPTTTVGVSLQRFSGNVGTLTFSHPRAWRETHYVWDSSFVDVIVYLSNTTLHDPCMTSGNTQTCGRPLTKLRPGDVLVTWQNVGFPHVGPEIPHPNTRIGGQTADVEVTRPGDGMCQGLGQNETVTADIARPQGNHYEMVACLRGPNLARNEALVRQMLASTLVTG